MTTREHVLQELLRYGGATVALLYALVGNGRSRKAIEAALSKLQANGLVAAYPFLGNKKLYVPTAKAARLYGFNEKRFSRPPGPQAISDRLLVLSYCQQNGHTLLTKREFEEKLPSQSACSGISRSKFYIDRMEEQPRLSVIVCDYAGSNLRRIVRKARKVVATLKTHQPFRDLLYNGLFQVSVVTPYAKKANRLHEILSREQTRYVVAAVIGLDDLLFSHRS